MGARLGLKGEEYCDEGKRSNEEENIFVHVYKIYLHYKFAQDEIFE